MTDRRQHRRFTDDQLRALVAEGKRRIAALSRSARTIDSADLLREAQDGITDAIRPLLDLIDAQKAQIEGLVERAERAEGQRGALHQSLRSLTTAFDHTLDIAVSLMEEEAWR